VSIEDDVAFLEMANVCMGDDAKALAAGCSCYVSKPFSPRALLAKVREYLA
jgi:CheY-like chemotaxis protein